MAIATARGCFGGHCHRLGGLESARVSVTYLRSLPVRREEELTLGTVRMPWVPRTLYLLLGKYHRRAT